LGTQHLSDLFRQAGKTERLLQEDVLLIEHDVSRPYGENPTARHGVAGVGGQIDDNLLDPI
jgi:hypothetical protein